MSREYLSSQNLIHSHLGPQFSTLSAALFFRQAEDAVAGPVHHGVRYDSQASPLAAPTGR
jgi:hypothetical protein